MKKAIPYYRVSTERQGNSGLGLEVQKQSVKQFAKQNDYWLQDEYIEVETGKKNDRPILLEALAACKLGNATLLIAKLDRLGRNVAFISKLMEFGVDFKAVDNPFASKLVVHIMAAFAEHERDIISERTRDALRVAKQKGIELGKQGKYVLSVQNRNRANDYAQTMKPLIAALEEQGIKTIRAITNELNKREIPTFRNENYKWHLTTVFNLLKRINKKK